MAKTRLSRAVLQSVATVQESLEKQEEAIQKKEKKQQIVADGRFRSSFVTNSAMWQEFSEINKKMSVTNNSALNMLISRFIQENKHLLEEE